MSDFTFIYVVGRLGLVAGDGVDLDEDPDTLWADEGTVNFKPINAYTKVSAGGSGSPIAWEAGQAVIDMAVDASGYLTRSGVRRAKFIDLTNPDVVNPVVAAGKATHTVEYRGIKADGTAISFTSGLGVRIAADTARPIATDAEATALGLPVGTMICVLTELTPVPTAGGTPIVRGEQGVGVESLDVAGDKLTYTLTNGESGETTSLPAPMVDSDAFVAGLFDDDNSLTAARANARIARLVQWAKNPDSIITGGIVRNGNGVVTSAAVVWPDGTPGTFTTDTIGPLYTVDAYHVTYGSPATKTFTQPTITRDSSGAATNVPAMVVS